MTGATLAGVVWILGVMAAAFLFEGLLGITSHAVLGPALLVVGAASIGVGVASES